MIAQSVVVIGAGPGGEAAAKHLAERGIAVTLVEQGPLGGLCLNWGCIPTKILLEAGRLSHQARASAVVARGSRCGRGLGKTSREKTRRRGLVSNARWSTGLTNFGFGGERDRAVFVRPGPRR
jgi:pyruvate/2-oxoglutarate dehydrogenase complex dihydrolipoamide dehydrogenase (E3) component